MSIAGYILTGGKNRRMNGEKKIFLSLNGLTFFDAIKETLSCFSSIYLSVDEEEPYQSLKLPCVVDEYPAFGPLGGIYSGLNKCPEDALFVVPCDMPLITKELIEMVLVIYKTHPDRIVVIKSDERIHPLFGIYPKSVLPYIEEMIRKNMHRVMDLFHYTEPYLISIQETNYLSNVNTPDEYEVVKQEVCNDRWIWKEH